jgi:hypothetical protein
MIFCFKLKTDSFNIFVRVPHLATYIFFLFQLLNEPELGAGIDPGMALTPFTSSIGQDLNTNFQS